MATLVQILGEPGSGKTYSMRNLLPTEAFYINADAKNMPFKGWKGKYNVESKNYLMSSDIPTIFTYLQRISDNAPHIKIVVIDTINSIMSDKEMSERKKKGYDKWMDLAGDIYDLYRLISVLREDLTVFCIAHTEDYVGMDGITRQRLKTNGAKLTKLNLEGLTTYTLYTKVSRGDAGNVYQFETQTNGFNTARSPEEVFETTVIANDMALVDKSIRDYELG
jgi:hypothetical protein